MVTRVGRRAFLRGIALSSLAPLGTARVAHAAKLSFGPACFDVTSRSAFVWLRPSGKARVHVEYGTQAALTNTMSTSPIDAGPGTDYTIVTELRDLTPDTEYFYRGVVSDSGKDPQRGVIGRFRTAPEGAREFRFAWSAGMDAGFQPFRLFDSVVRQHPDFFLHLGSTIYADVPRERFATTLTHYRWKHRENRDDKFLQRALAAMPAFATWDDREVEAGFDAKHRALPLGRQAFREYWPLRTTDPAVLYRRFSWTPNVEFFLLDCRSYRSPQSNVDDASKTMLGSDQKTWLKEGLKASKAIFKFVVSSSPFLPTRGADSWARYTIERQELRHFLHAESIRNVIVLSGHMTLDLSNRQGIDEFLAGPIAATPHCATGGNDRARLLLEEPGRFVICDDLTYGLVVVQPDASPPQLEVQFIDARNTVRFRRTITASL